MTQRTVLGLLAALMVTGAAGPVLAATDADRARNWALGWERALVARRQLGPWHVGVSAGPNDFLADEDSRVWIVDEPDSLQGRDDDARAERRESGFVALEVGRRLAVQEELSLAATVGGRYRWSDYRNEYSWPSDLSLDQPSRQEVRDQFDEWWGLSLGARLSWRPVPFVGLEAHFGLVYEWHDRRETRWNRDPGVWDWDRTEETYHSQSFDDFGFYGITDLAILVWF